MACHIFKKSGGDPGPQSPPHITRGTGQAETLGRHQQSGDVETHPRRLPQQPMKTFAFLSIAAAAVVGAMTSVDLVKKGDHNAAALFAGFTAFAAASSVCTIGSIIDEA